MDHAARQTRPLLQRGVSPPGHILPRDLWPELTGLSPRECEIVRLVANDRTNKQISVTLGISVWTVSTHLRRIFAKLDVHSRAAMVAEVFETVRGSRADRDPSPSWHRSDDR